MKIPGFSPPDEGAHPGWARHAGDQMFYAGNLQSKRVVAQRINIALHIGTDIDGAMDGSAKAARNGAKAILGRQGAGSGPLSSHEGR